MMWGRSKENGLWLSRARQYRLMICGGDRLVYLAIHCVRLRLMKPWRAAA
jgi:hypothetical protein